MALATPSSVKSFKKHVSSSDFMDNPIICFNSPKASIQVNLQSIEGMKCLLESDLLPFLFLPFDVLSGFLSLSSLLELGVVPNFE
jgi:hypothetical protein